jgi:hypothetical protein
MEGIAVNTQNILDACTIINFLHIDEDEFLIKKLKAKKFNLCRKVFEETNKNVFNKFKGSLYNQNLEVKSKIKEVEIKLNYFRERIYYSEDYFQLKEEVAALTNYSKENGEFISVLLSFYLSKYEELSIIFHTDDIPAKQHFLPFFESENIGSINDSIDLLLLLFKSNTDFTSNDLKKYFSSLYSEYTFAIGGLLKEINEFQIPSNLIRNKQFRITRDAIWQSLKTLDILSLINQYYLVVEHKSEFRPLYDILSKYEYFFKQKISNEYLTKIKYHFDYYVEE